MANTAGAGRAVTVVLGHDRATLIGHSLGGGIAMPFSYQFPEMVERLVLVSPARHALDAHEAIPGSRLEVFDGAGHLPQLEVPGRFVAVVERFLAETEPARSDVAAWRARFREAPAAGSG